MLIVYSVVYVLIVYGGFPDKCGGGANPVRGITRMDASIASLNTQQATFSPKMLLLNISKCYFELLKWPKSDMEKS